MAKKITKVLKTKIKTKIILSRKTLFNSINSDSFYNHIESGINNLRNNLKEINSINVFPIPDGDTGTNLTVTLLNGLHSIKNYKSNNMYQLLNKFSEGLLIGARGNSGIIFAQIIRGFSNGFKKSNKYTIKNINRAILLSKKHSYKAISNPVEGTIISIIYYLEKYTTKKLNKSADLSTENIFKIINDDAKKALEKTTSQMDILASKNIVDSGAMGLCKFIEGIYFSICGNFVQKKVATEDEGISKIIENKHTNRLDYTKTFLGYCLELIIQLKKNKSFKQKWLNNKLEFFNFNSVILTKRKNILKCHIHGFKPYYAMKICHKYGEFLEVKIDNMSLQNNHFQTLTNKDKEIEYSDDVSVISYVKGKGWTNEYKKLSIQKIILYDNYFSSSDLIQEIQNTYSKNIIVIANNKRLFSKIAACFPLIKNQNCKLLKTYNDAEGYASTLFFDKSVKLKNAYKNMKENIKHFNIFVVKKSNNTSNYLVYSKNKIIHKHLNLLILIKNMLLKSIDDFNENVTVFREGTYLEQTDNELIKFFKLKFKSIELEFKNGLNKNHIYSFLIS